jgi:uroporphyrinogen-III synthase
MRILITRPEPDASHEAAALAARGHETVAAPLLSIEFNEDAPLQLAGAQAVLVTSRNALRALAGHRALGEALKLPLVAVGEATARDAQALGFADVTVGPGTGAELAKLVPQELEPEQGALVHLAGETLAFDLKGALEKQGFSVRQAVLYRAVAATALPDEAVAALTSGKLDGAILMSPRTARILADLLSRHDALTQGKRLICYCLSEAVAEVLTPLGFSVRVAARPREEDVLALLNSEAASS